MKSDLFSATMIILSAAGFGGMVALSLSLILVSDHLPNQIVGWLFLFLCALALYAVYRKGKKLKAQRDRE